MLYDAFSCRFLIGHSLLAITNDKERIRQMLPVWDFQISPSASKRSKGMLKHFCFSTCVTRGILCYMFDNRNPYSFHISFALLLLKAIIPVAHKWGLSSVCWRSVSVCAGVTVCATCWMQTHTQRATPYCLLKPGHVKTLTNGRVCQRQNNKSGAERTESKMSY